MNAIGARGLCGVVAGGSQEILAAPDRLTYSDLAIAPPSGDEFDRLDLYHATAGAGLRSFASVGRTRYERVWREGNI